MSGLEQASRVLDAHLFQYLESDRNRAIEREIMSDKVTISPPWEMISTMKEVLAFDIEATMPIII